MSILFSTTTPQKLLDTYRLLIKQKHVFTWEQDGDGDFYHSPPQWKGLGWLRPSIDVNGLQVRFLGPKDKLTTYDTFGVYQGRFIESMTAHCAHLFVSATATARPSNIDIVTMQRIQARGA